MTPAPATLLRDARHDAGGVIVVVRSAAAHSSSALPASRRTPLATGTGAGGMA